jgi:acetyl/propionyl-CoA carboxylase alpha subunit
VYETVLVAARGPVAGQVVRTCQRTGARAVTVHSEGDASALHVAEADDSVLLGPAPPEQSYLDVRRVVEAARQAGAQAVHPGGGALALDADVAHAVLDAGIAWVGAAPDVLAAARARAAATGPGRHLTVHVLAPAGGPPVALCDLERVDDLDPCGVAASPAPGLDVQERGAVADTAVQAVAALGLRGVAAVDVVVGPDGRPQAGQVRCALPVEHPVSELRCGLDLVEQQLRAAAGEPGPERPAAGAGAALLLRVYARDLPGAGARITRWREPAGVRVDSGYREGDVVPSWYEPLLATVTVAGASPAEALDSARAAVDGLVVEGPSTNLPRLAQVLAELSSVRA